MISDNSPSKVERFGNIGAGRIEKHMILQGTLRLSPRGRTAGLFSKLINDNAATFRHYFGVDLFPGSLNVDVTQPASLQTDLDEGRPKPAILIPKRELINMPHYIGDGQAWACELTGRKFPAPVSCWIFRRIGSRVPRGVIEIVARAKLRDAYGLEHGEKVAIELFSDGPNDMLAPER
jgi:CTP-dependent riboflavin kinase